MENWKTFVTECRYRWIQPTNQLSSVRITKGYEVEKQGKLHICACFEQDLEECFRPTYGITALGS